MLGYKEYNSKKKNIVKGYSIVNHAQRKALFQIVKKIKKTSIC